jgi:mutator family transposase
MAGADRMQVEEVVRKVLVDEHADVLRKSVGWLAQRLMEAEVSELIGAEPGERTEDRATHRNRYRPRRWDTRAGEIELQIPKTRQGSYFPVVPSTSRAFPSRRCCRWCSRRTCAACRPGASISLSRASGCVSAGRRSAGSARGWMSRSRRFAGGRWRAAS